MKKLFKHFLFILSNLYFSFLVKKSRSRIVIIDIDNTIANTWPTLLQDWDNESQRIYSIEPIFSVIDYINHYYPESSYTRIYLSNRSYFYFFDTYKWLKKVNMNTNFNVVFVPKPEHKINLFKKHHEINFIYFDDLSFNHEKGNVLYFDKEISYVNMNKNIKYYGHKKILSIIENSK